jgi:trehalose/maltose transport system substrate-binding protein
MTVISPSVLGGWGVCISKHSQQKEAAINLVQWLVRPEEQKRRALEGGYFPSIVALYTDAAVLAKNLHFPMIKKAVDTAVIRPVAAFGRFYPQMSAAVTNIVQKVISHEVDPTQGAEQLIEAVASFQKKAQEAGVAASTP